MKIATTTMEKSMEVSLENKYRATIWSSNPIPRHISGEKNGLKGCMNPSVHCNVVYSSQDRKATYISVNRSIDKDYVVPAHSGILLSH